MTDILLAHGFFLEEDPREQQVMRPYPPLGILYLSAFLKRAGIACEVFDSTFRHFSEFEQTILKLRPAIVGIYCNLMTKRSVIGMIRTCKKHGAFVVLGGPEPPSYIEEYLSIGTDVIVIGEGEATLLELIQHLRARGTDGLDAVMGIAFKKSQGNVVKTTARPLIDNLDSLPMPDREAISLESYMSAWKRRHGYSSLSLITARGCPYTCTWCSHGVYGFSHRRRSPESVAAEIEHLRARYNPDTLWVADDVFTINHGWLLKFHDEVTRRNLQLPFECISRADRVNEEVVNLLSDLRCTRMWLGSESGSQRILDAMKRGVKTEEIRTITQLAQQRGIDIGLFVMLGYDGETLKDIEATIEHLKRTQARTFLTTVAYPIKGTAYHKTMEDRTSLPGTWESTTDRDHRVGGRFSSRFYWFAQRRMTNEVLLASTGGARRGLGTRLAAFSKAKTAQIGMWLTQWQRS